MLMSPVMKELTKDLNKSAILPLNMRELPFIDIYKVLMQTAMQMVKLSVKEIIL